MTRREKVTEFTARDEEVFFVRFFHCILVVRFSLLQNHLQTCMQFTIARLTTVTFSIVVTVVLVCEEKDSPSNSL